MLDGGGGLRRGENLENPKNQHLQQHYIRYAGGRQCLDDGPNGIRFGDLDTGARSTRCARAVDDANTAIKRKNRRRSDVVSNTCKKMLLPPHRLLLPQSTRARAVVVVISVEINSARNLNYLLLPHTNYDYHRRRRKTELVLHKHASKQV